MSEEKFLVRNVINPTVVDSLSQKIKNVYPDFKAKSFAKHINIMLPELEYKERIEIIADSLEQYLPKDFEQAIEIINKSLGDILPERDVLGDRSMNDRFYIVALGLFVSRNGIENFEVSMNSLYEQTKRFTSENAIRFFIEKYPNESLELIKVWTQDQSQHVRRLCSEGIRPRLPWAMQLKSFIKDPSPVIEILTLLKNDPAMYVRRSVANCLNDIAKDHPDIVTSTLEQWQDGTEEINWLTKHALRTLVKKGNQIALKLIGFDDGENLEISEIKLNTTELVFGNDLEFEFTIKSEKDKPASILIDYAIHYMKHNAKLAPKVYKLTKFELAIGESKLVQGIRPFVEISTRRFYSGIHKIEILANGKSLGIKQFELIKK
jgi:3-methyladenine DNA glycosylase AlkC